ncbi:RluA family pseudouridine synthase [Rubripirellula reticaptiva]|uniref:Ribosomal large subunit pseudouridine synthase A n=1 Tax=Rubripirellula reticaptiva TaxID=2528013 RepID=A0A5C6EFI4_9BACT|nr:RluA family pseudouridine synthase [Rubripirellula reticaptiva]TWU47762.1 Ribosomal large subunit pseudouridine synthase A [Rubripirellula reticaptiva]
MSNLSVLFEDNHLLVVNKPAGIATMGAEPGMPTVHEMACDYVRIKYQKPGKVFIGVVSRLDLMTTGTLVLARTSKSASRLTPQFADKSGGGAGKIYLAIVEGLFGVDNEIEGDQGFLVDHVRKDEPAKRMRVVPDGRDTQEAALRYIVLGRTEQATVMAIQLISGRKHQIRVQFADRGFPVLGDVKYGGRRGFAPGIALHSWRLKVDHPTLKNTMEFVSPVPDSWDPWAGILGKPETLWKRVKRSFEIDE